jgi:hypothetical protein
MQGKYGCRGLSAGEVAQSRASYGGNDLPPPATESFWEKYLQNLADPLIKVCASVYVCMCVCVCGGGGGGGVWVVKINF